MSSPIPSPVPPVSPNTSEGEPSNLLSMEAFQAAIEAQQEAERIEELIRFRDSDEAKRLVSWVQSEHKKMSSSREKERRQWVINLAYYNRLHDAKIAGQGSILPAGSLYVPPKSTSNLKRKVNRIRSIVRTEISKLVAQKPGVTIVPATSDQTDMFAAQAGENVFHSISYRCGLYEQFSKAAFWLSITGNGFLKVSWDPKKYDRDSETDGDVEIESVTPFHLFFPDLREEDIERQPYVLQLTTKSVQWLNKFFSAELEGVTLTPTSVSQDSILEAKYLNTDDSERKPDSCLVYEMWVKPGGSEYLPDGGYVTIVDNTVVGYSNEGIPYKHGNYPFVHMGHVPTGKFYRASVVEDLLELQDDYNDSVSLIANSRRKMAKPQIVAQKGSITASKMTNEIALVIEYKPGTPPPSPLPLSELPSYVFNEQERITRDFEDLSGQHEVSRGSAPTGVTAATAISFLQERDDSYMGPTFSSVERGFEKIGRLVLSLAVQYWTTQRVVKVAGDESEFDVRQLTGSDIANGTDLRVEENSMIPFSMAARRAMVLDLMNTGHITSAQGLELLEIGGSQKLMDHIQQDRRQAQRENVRMRQSDPEELLRMQTEWENILGNIEEDAPADFDPESPDPETGMSPKPLLVPVNEWDNHEIHIEVHNSYRKSQEFEGLSPEHKQLFQDHVAAHKQAKQAAMLQELLSQIPTEGEDTGELPEEGSMEPGAEEAPAGSAPAADSGPGEITGGF